jgi:hypothetical protein
MTADVPKRVRVVCPDCGKTVRAVRVSGRDFYRLSVHGRPGDAETFPGQTCTASPLVSFDRIVIAEEERP